MLLDDFSRPQGIIQVLAIVFQKVICFCCLMINFQIIFWPFISCFLTDINPVYKQPVTIAEISDLRGVNSISSVKNLLQKKLIKISGRKRVPGLPALYSTTKEFLLYFGLNDLTELPSLEELTEMFEEKEQPSLFW